MSLRFACLQILSVTSQRWGEDKFCQSRMININVLWTLHGWPRSSDTQGQIVGRAGHLGERKRRRRGWGERRRGEKRYFLPNPSAIICCWPQFSARPTIGPWVSENGWPQDEGSALRPTHSHGVALATKTHEIVNRLYQWSSLYGKCNNIFFPILSPEDFDPVIFHLNELWKAKFSILCGVIFLARL